MLDTLARRWTFTQPSPIGDVKASWEVSAEGLRFSSDAPMGPRSELLRWDEIDRASTAVLDLPAAKGGPATPQWMPGRLEWLLVSRSGRKGALMRPLPASGERDSIVCALRERLGSRWAGERLPLEDAKREFQIGARGDTLKVAALVLSVLAMLFGLLFVLAIVSSIALLPAVIGLGGWLFHRGLRGLADALQMTNMPTARVSSAAMGLVELQGQALTDAPSAAAASGRPSVRWEVAVDVWSEQGNGRGKRKGWQQVLERHGGSGQLLLEDATGRVPVWLRDADVLLREHTWELGKDALPPGGAALINAVRWACPDRARMRVREKRIEAGATLYVLGTLDEGRRVLAPAHEGPTSRMLRLVRTGQWREPLLRSLPELVRVPVIVLFGYLDMLLGTGGDQRRAQHLDAAPLPAVGPADVLVWKGTARRAFVVSDCRETEALSMLRKRSLWILAAGVGVLCFVLHELVK